MRSIYLKRYVKTAKTVKTVKTVKIATPCDHRIKVYRHKLRNDVVYNDVVLVVLFRLRKSNRDETYDVTRKCNIRIYYRSSLPMNRFIYGYKTKDRKFGFSKYSLRNSGNQRLPTRNL